MSQLTNQSQNQNNVVLKPLRGSQTIFLQLADVYEVLYHGSRGFGKSTAIFLDFMRYVGKGYGSKYRGMIVRDEFSGLEDLKAEFLDLVSKIYPDVDGKQQYSFNKKEGVFEFPTGEILYFSHFKTIEDAESKIKGKNLTYICFDELTNWPSYDVYEFAGTSLRTTIPGMMTRIRATTNPYGVGKAWVKRYFIDTCGESSIKMINGLERATVKGHHTENTFLDEKYILRLKNLSDDARRNAFYYGSWEGAGDTVFSGCFDKKYNVIPEFLDASLSKNQFQGLYLYRSFDWGFGAPFSLGWLMFMDGRPLKLQSGLEHKFLYGDLVRVYEYYGVDRSTSATNKGVRKTPYEVRQIGLDIEEMLKKRYNIPILKGGADLSIFSAQGSTSDTASIADQLKPLNFNKLKTSAQISRANGLATMQNMFRNANPVTYKHLPQREETALYVTENCKEAIEQIQNLPRDKKKPDDVDTNVEDHLYDEWRYSVMYLARPRMSYSIHEI